MKTAASAVIVGLCKLVCSAWHWRRTDSSVLVNRGDLRSLCSTRRSTAERLALGLAGCLGDGLGANGLASMGVGELGVYAVGVCAVGVEAE